MGRGLAQMAPCLRCCFLGRSHRQLSGVLLLPVPAQVESVPGLGQGSRAPPTVRWPSCQLLAQEQVCDPQQEHLPHSPHVGPGQCQEIELKVDPAPGSSTEQASFFAQLRAEMPWSLALESESVLLGGMGGAA